MLIPTDLATRLEQEWLGQFPDSSAQSGDMFAGAVSGWFATSMALTFPCATAAARRVQLAATAAAALEAGIGPTSGALLAVAVAGYYAGQVYGTGIATFPVALPSGILLMTTALLDLNLPKSARATQIAQACHVMAISTLVVFTVPPSSGPIV